MSAPHIAVIGNVNVDMILGPQAPWPMPGTEVVLPDYELRIGGSAGNAALALHALGVRYRLLANTGDDVLGHWLQSGFGEAATHWRRTSRPTTVSVGITHPNGERTFFTNSGHLDVFAPDDVLPHLDHSAPAGSLALVAGTFLSPPMVEGLPALLETLAIANYRVALDTGWPPGGRTECVRRNLAEWLARTDLLLLNEVEALGFANTGNLTEAVVRIRALMAQQDATLVVKQGKDGASAWRGGDTAHALSPPTLVADSIGAGDIFNAGYLAAELAGNSLQNTLRAAVEFASRVIATRPRSYRITG